MRRKSKFVVVLGVVFRVLLVTAIATLMGFALGLFCGIGAGVLYGAIRHVHPDMTMAYKFVAAPFGAVALVITFCVMLFTEIRRLRRPLEMTRSSALHRTS